MPEMQHPALKLSVTRIPDLSSIPTNTPDTGQQAVKVGSVFTRSFKSCSKLSLSFPEKERVWGRSRSADTNIFLRGLD